MYIENKFVNKRERRHWVGDEGRKGVRERERERERERGREREERRKEESKRNQ